MITQAILDFFAAMLGQVLDLLPTLDPPDLSAAGDSIGAFLTPAAWLDQYLPLHECLGFIALLVVAYGLSFAFSGLLWVLTKAHILGGSDA
jgi:hypothetical protein